MNRMDKKSKFWKNPSVLPPNFTHSYSVPLQEQEEQSNNSIIKNFFERTTKILALGFWFGAIAFTAVVCATLAYTYAIGIPFISH